MIHAKAAAFTALLCLGFSLPVRATESGDVNRARESDLVLEGTRSVEFDTDSATWLSLDVSPDGASLVVEVLGDLYLLPAEGGQARPLTRGMAFDSQPRFSPDGARVAFISDRSGAENVWVIGTDGEGARRLSDNEKMAQFASPSWARDGSHVIVSRTTWGLRTYEVWAFHIDGGKGVKLTDAKPRSDTPANQRGNALGAVYGPGGRYLYYAYKQGGFGYNLQLPQWQIVRHDLTSGAQDRLTEVQGSAFRPLLSPDGDKLVYGTRYEQQTGLRIRDLNNGDDQWLVYPVTHDEQESRFTRDLLPGYAFSSDGDAVLFARDGGIARVDVGSGEVTQVPFDLHVARRLGPELRFPYRLGVGPVRARMVRDPAVSPDGTEIAFSAFTRIRVHDPASGETRVVSPDGVEAFHPAWSPDGRWLAYVSWSHDGGHVWRVRANGRGSPQRLTRAAAYYTDPAYSPDGERIVALRAGSYDRLYRENDFGAPVGSDVVWLPADGGEARLVIPSRGFSRPHFGPEADRIYLYETGANGQGLASMRYDGTDRRNLMTVKGPGYFTDEGDVPADDVRIAPDGHHALILHANQLYVASLINRYMQNLRLSLDRPSVPLARLTDVGADFFGWGPNGEIFWSTGDSVYRRPLTSVTFETAGSDEEAEVDEDDGEGETGGADEEATSADATTAASDEDDANAPSGNEASDNEPLKEADEAVERIEIAVYAPRHVPAGTIALVGATILPMTDSETVISDGVVLVKDDRIVAVGARGDLDVPADAERLDLEGRYVLPGFVDTHAHFRPLRRVLDTDNWAFLANLAYGVTTGIDVQPSTTDILSYQDLVDAGMMIGPRALSTGPGIFSNNDFESRRHTEAVLRRYRDSYRVHNLKAYIAGNRKQRQWIVQAARELELMPTTEGGLDMKLDLTHVIDGMSGNEHNLPVLTLYRDVVELMARSGVAYTPTLLVSYGGPFAESWFYTRESPHDDPKLRRFMPYNVIASRTLRGPWFRDEEYPFPKLAAQAAKIVRAGGRVGVGGHGQLQGLGYHWEMRALASGMTNWEVLTAATRNGAEMIGVAEDIGTLEPGKLADLVVLDADPLADIRNTESLEYVMKNGELFEADTLDQVYPEQQPLPEQWWWTTGPPDQPSSE